MASERTAAAGRQARRGPPRPDGHAAVLRLPHGRLFRPLARHGQADDPAAQDLPRQLVPHRRARQVPLARLRREPAGDQVDPGPLPRRGRRRAKRPSATSPRPKASTSPGLGLLPRNARKTAGRQAGRLAGGSRPRRDVLREVRRPASAGTPLRSSFEHGFACSGSQPPLELLAARRAKSAPWPPNSTASIERENPHVFAMLSDLGRRLYFPKGILAQSAEAKEKANRYNATIGIAWEDGKPMFLPSVMRFFNELEPGRGPDLRPGHRPARSAAEMARGPAGEEPQPGREEFSLPVVTGGVTHALSVMADLFVDPGDMVLRARQLLGELRPDLRRPPPGAACACTRSSARRAGLTSRGSAGRWHPAGRLEDHPDPQFPQQSDRLLASPAAEMDATRGRAARGGGRGPQPDRRGRRRLFRPLLRRRRGPGVGLRPAGRLPPAAAGGEGRWPDQGEVRLGLPHRHVDLRRARPPAATTAPLQGVWKRRRPAPSAAPSRTARTWPIGPGQGHGRRRRSPPSGGRRRRSSRPGPDGSTKSSPRPSTPTSGSRTPSTPATSCA